MLPSEITEETLAKGYPALRIRTDLCEAVIALHGAHLTHWQPLAAGHPVIYTSPTANYCEGKAIRGGIPLCWPWFNAHPDAPGKHPAHGVARNRLWTLESATVSDGQARVTLTLPPSDSIREHVPFDYELRAIFTLGNQCEVALETRNLSTGPIAVGGALHSYLAVSDLAAITIAGLEQTPYLDTTTSPEGEMGGDAQPLTITGEVDRIYYSTSNGVTITDSSWRRKILIEKENSLTTVVWNPWQEKAAALSDLPDDGYTHFVCIEAANARHDTRSLAPGETHRLATRISVVC